MSPRKPWPVFFLCNKNKMEQWKWPASMDKGTWGPRAWAWLHNLAINYPPRPRPAEMRIAYDRVINFVTNIPCPECRLHATQYVRQFPPDLSGSEAFQRWAWKFHNAVNWLLGRPAFPLAAYQAMYADEICWASAVCSAADRISAERITAAEPFGHYWTA